MFKLPKVPILLPLANLWSKHDRTILTVASGIGVITSVAIAIRDRPKYENILWECEDDDCTRLEAGKRLLPATIPLMVSTATTLILIFWNNYRSGKKITELTNTASGAINAYMVGKAIHDEYKEKYGPEVDDEMSRKATQKRAAAEYSDSGYAERIVDTGHGNDLFYDEWSGTFFYCNWNWIEKCANDAERKVQQEHWIEVGEIYRAWGWPSNRIPTCAKMGWNIDDGAIELYSPECEFSEDHGKPYGLVRFVKKPGMYAERRRY
jgi:hypothetical protein